MGRWGGDIGGGGVTLHGAMQASNCSNAIRTEGASSCSTQLYSLDNIRPRVVKKHRRRNIIVHAGGGGGPADAHCIAVLADAEGSDAYCISFAKHACTATALQELRGKTWPLLCMRRPSAGARLPASCCKPQQ
jgi:hypothetical protein